MTADSYRRKNRQVFSHFLYSYCFWIMLNYDTNTLVMAMLDPQYYQHRVDAESRSEIGVLSTDHVAKR